MAEMNKNERQQSAESAPLQSWWKHGATLLVLLVAPTLVALSLELPFAPVLGLTISAVLLWLTEIVPVGITGMLIPVGAILLSQVTPEESFTDFGSQIVFLLVSVFLLVRAIEKHHLHQYVAALVIGAKSSSCEGIVLKFTLLGYLVGMWLSNTVTAALLTPIALGLIKEFSERSAGQVAQKDNREDAGENTTSQKHLSLRLLLTAAFIPGVAGMATPVGSLPNVVAIQFLSEKGIHVSFLDWMTFALPFSLFSATFVYWVLRVRYPLGKQQWPVREAGSVTLSQTQPLSGLAKLTAGCAVFTVLLWILPGLPRLPLFMPPLFAVVLLFVLKSGGESPLIRDDISKIGWNTILMFGGGLTLARVLDSSGAGAALGALLFDGGVSSPFLIGIGVTALGIILSEISSNTAAAALLVPVVYESTRALPPELAAALIGVTVIACGYGFMFPVSTPPNGIVFNTGKVPIREMCFSGVIIDTVGIVAIPSIAILLVRWFGISLL